jgi:1-acyl-sn-glycerol-3-phosphate acyltransferase
MKQGRTAKKEFIVVESQTLRVLDLLSFVLCAYISYSLSGSVFAGAIASMLGFGIENYLRLHARKGFMANYRGYLPLLFLFSILLPVIGMITIRPVTANLLIILLAAAWFTARSALTHHLILRHADDWQSCIRLMIDGHAAAIALLLPLLGLSAGWLFAVRVTAIACIYPLAVFIWLYRSRRISLVCQANYAASRIASYRLYQAQLLCSNTALYLSLMMYAAMFVLMPQPDWAMPPAEVWLALAATIIFVAGRLIRRRLLKNMEKMTLFLMGATICLVAHLELSASYVALNLWAAWFWSLIQAAGLAMMMLLATYLQEDMRLVLELTDDADDAADKTYRSFAQQVAFFIAGILVCVEMYFLDLLIHFDWPAAELGLRRGQYLWLTSVLPLGFVSLAVLFAIRQPINRDLVRKLQLYYRQKIARTVIPEFEAKLRRLLLKRYHKRIGIKIVANVLKPWYRHRIIGTENVRLGSGPVIFVANHREIYGPIAAYLYIPFPFRPWIEHRMLERDEIMRYLWDNTFAKVRPVWLGRAALALAGPFLIWALNAIEPIPVYRGAVRDLIQTLNQSVLALQEQDNLLLFPEDASKTADGRYAQIGVSPFFTGFVSVARAYFKKTGKSVTFYPVYLNPKDRTIRFGTGVTYNPRGMREDLRICAALQDSMNEMAGLPVT